MTPSSGTDEILEQDPEGPDEKSRKKSDTIDDSIDATASMHDSIDATDSSDIDTITELSTTTSKSELNLPTNLQKHKSVARSRTPLRHSVMEDFPTLYNNKDNSPYESKNWYYEEGLNGGNSNDKDILVDWSHKHGFKHGLHSNHESHSNSVAHSNHLHNSEKGDFWQANDYPDDDDAYDEWSSLHLKGVQHHHKGVGLEEELSKLPKKIHFGDKVRGSVGKSHYSKDWVGSHTGSKSWGGLDLDSKQSGNSHADSYGKWRAHLKLPNWEGLHSGGTAGDIAYHLQNLSGSETLGGSHYYKNNVFSNEGVSPTHYNSGKSRSNI